MFSICHTTQKELQDGPGRYDSAPLGPFSGVLLKIPGLLPHTIHPDLICLCFSYNWEKGHRILSSGWGDAWERESCQGANSAQADAKSQLRTHAPPLSGAAFALSLQSALDVSWQLAPCHFPFFMPTHRGMKESREISFLAPTERMPCSAEAETEPAWF